MRDRGLRGLPWLALAVSVGGGVTLISGGGEGPPEVPPAVEVVRERPSTSDVSPDQAGGERTERDEFKEMPAQQAIPRIDRELAAAERAYRDYIEAINARDGAALSALLGADGVEALDLPVERGSPEERLSASIGFEDPRGFPVWAKTTLASVDSAEELPSGAIQVTATIVTDFADRPEPSVETDVAYLDSDGTLLKPSAAIYRAVGKPDVPPSVIAAP